MMTAIPHPTLELEMKLRQAKGVGRIAGLDEAGRGALAGRWLRRRSFCRWTPLV
jgi:hypothetical protein